MRKVFGALLALATVFGGLTAGAPSVSAAGNYIVSINDANAGEGTSATFTISLQQFMQSGDTITVQAATQDGTAVGAGVCGAGSDYRSSSATIVLTQAQPTGTFTVQTCDDASAEGDETFIVQLSNESIDCGGDTPCTVTIGDGTGTGTIVDNEVAASASPSPSPSAPGGSPGPVPPTGTGPTTLAVVDVHGRSGPNHNCQFSVNRLGNASGTSSVSFASQGRPNLIANVVGTLVFGPGETVRTIEIDVLRRPRRERFATLILSGAVNAQLTDGIAVCELKTKKRLHHPRRSRR